MQRDFQFYDNEIISYSHTGDTLVLYCMYGFHEKWRTCFYNVASVKGEDNLVGSVIAFFGRETPEGDYTIFSGITSIPPLSEQKITGADFPAGNDLHKNNVGCNIYSPLLLFLTGADSYLRILHAVSGGRIRVLQGVLDAEIFPLELA